MTHFEKSLIYERAYGQIAYLYVNTKYAYGKECKAAVAEHREPDESYKVVMSMLSSDLEKCRAISDEAFALHKSANKYLNDDGIDNLIIGILERAAQDYSDALCAEDINKQAEIERFANGYAKTLSDVNFENVLYRAKANYAQFKYIIRHYTNELYEDSCMIQKNRNYKVRHPCPVCGGNILGGAPSKCRLERKDGWTKFQCGRCGLYGYGKVRKDGESEGQPTQRAAQSS